MNLIKWVKKFPVRQAAQTGLLMGTGDAIAQVQFEKKTWKNFNFVRSAQFSMIGFFYVGPSLGVWYKTLHRTFGSGTKEASLKKVACDQILFAPVFIGSLLAVIPLVQGETVERATSDLKKNWLDVVINNYKLWPAVQLINFYFVPLNYQVLVVQFIAIFWNSYISWITNKGCDEAEGL